MISARREDANSLESVGIVARLRRIAANADQTSVGQLTSPGTKRVGRRVQWAESLSRDGIDGTPSSVTHGLQGILFNLVENEDFIVGNDGNLRDPTHCQPRSIEVCE